MKIINLLILSSNHLPDLLAQKNNSTIIFSALNLFMLGFLRKNIAVADKLHYWIDGISAKYFLFFFKGVLLKQIRGREFLEKVLSSCEGKTVTIFGNCDDLEKSLLIKYGVEIRTHYPMPSAEKLLIPSGFIDEIVIVTLPSPIQERLALKLYDAHYGNISRIFCVGGALSMLARPKLDCPYFIRIFGLEFLYRLRTDPRRRLMRLMRSIYDFIAGFIKISKASISIVKRWDTAG